MLLFNKTSDLMKGTVRILILCLVIHAMGCADTDVSNGPHVVFLMGDEEYRSEESMPMLARILRRELGARISLCYAVDTAGFVDPNRLDHIAGLEALETADLMVMFLRFRALPRSELKYITDYVESGRPVVGFRTSTHAFLYRDDPSLEHMNNTWPVQVFGQQWITHHGHFDDGDNPLTSVTLVPDATHPILQGVEPFDAYSWLYHVHGGDWKLPPAAEPLLNGTALRSNHADQGRLDKFPLTNPVAWTKTYTGTSGLTARVFFTTLGHPYDFHSTSMRKLALNGMYWALGREDAIPPDGVDVAVEGEYDPNNSGFGKRYKPGMRPLQLD
ncbi:MAG: ThuA domain-containing protein [Saprospiraceae bacterium]|nr:ThuA domain-containing protein [Saprospiraceae bacterium]